MLKPQNGLNNSKLKRRALICMGAIMLFYSCLAGRVAYLHYTRHDKAVARAEKVMSGARSLHVGRAAIKDSKGRILAISAKEYGLAIDPQVVGNIDVVVASLKGVLKLRDDEVKRIKKYSAKDGCRFVWIRRKLSDSQYKSVSDIGLEGVRLVPGWDRSYPHKETACHLLGFTNIDGTGLEGLEARWDFLLQSEDGSQKVLRDARRRAFIFKDEKLDFPEKGWDIKTSIDLYIQSVVEIELEKINKKYKPLKAIGLVMEPFTGEVLAMANTPSFDLNNAGEVDAAVRLNSAVATVYEPGSIFKPFIMSAALDSGVVSCDTPIFCENGAWNLRYRTLHDAHGYGSLSAEYVVVKSSNIGIAKIGQKVGKKILYKYLHDFGFGRKTGANLIGEVSGLLRPPEKWSNHFSMTSVPMGQEVSVTSLQLVSAFSSVVNGGIYLKPKFINAIHDPDKGRDKIVEAEPVRKVIRRETSRKMRSVLQNVVEKGTGRRAKSNLYSIGGKTGTAQIAGIGGYQEGKYVGSFIGFAPADYPKVVVLVSVFEPHGAYYGGVVSAPSVKEIIEKSLLYMKVPPKIKNEFVMR